MLHKPRIGLEQFQEKQRAAASVDEQRRPEETASPYQTEK
jgi:hypothetical protein